MAEAAPPPPNPRRARALVRLAAQARDLWPVRLLPTTRAGVRQVAELRAAELAAAARAYAAAGSDPPRPLHADRAWRPAPWGTPVASLGGPPPAPGVALAEGTRLFHDLPEGAPARLSVTATADGPAPAGLALAWEGFAGRFLSLAIDLPQAACDGLTAEHLIVAHLVLALPPEVPANLRLNVVSGPNCIARTTRLRPPAQGGPVMVAVDMIDLVPTRGVDRMWCDLVLSHLPDTGAVRVADLSLARCPRARV